MVGEYGVCTQRLSQVRNEAVGRPLQHDQARLGVLRQGAQAAVQFHQRLTDEFHAPVLAWQGGEDGAVKDEYAVHLLALQQGVVQGGVVLGAQVAAEPDQPRAVGCRHVDRKIQRCPPILRP